MIAKVKKLPNSPIVLLVLDGLGLGPMADAKIKGNTWKTITDYLKPNQLPLLRKLIDQATPLALDYQGADSFLGHLTLSGVDVKEIELLPLAFFQKQIVTALEKKQYQTRIYQGLIIVDEAVIIGDNFEAEHGLAINLTGCRDLISQKEQNKIATIVRNIVSSTRVISFGANKMSIENYLKYIIFEEQFVGLNTPETGVYNETYDVIHLGTKINFKASMQAQLIKEKNYQVFLVGKFADIINLEKQTINYPAVKTEDIFEYLDSKLQKANNNTLFCLNVQETDLAGHSLDVKKYIEVLIVVEKYLQYLFAKYPYARWIITGDHGNDPGINSSNHTREYVPFIYVKQKQAIPVKLKYLSEIADFIISLTNTKTK